MTSVLEPNETLYEEEEPDPYGCRTYTPNKTYQHVLAYCGTTAAVIAILQNGGTIVALIHDIKRCLNSYYLILIILLFFDLISAISYVPMVVTDQLADRIGHTWFYKWSHRYGGEIIALTSISLIASCYLIVVLQLERFCLTDQSYRKLVNPKCRLIAVTVAVMLALIMKGPLYFEFQVVYLRDPVTNTNFTRMLPVESSSELYNTFYKIWARHLLCTFAPFFLLIGINIRIVMRLRRAKRRAKLFRSIDTDGHKNRVRSATRGFLLITATYLASNSISVLLTVWENVHIDSLAGRFCRFYIAASDMVSFLTITGCALRVPICLLTNEDLRRTAQYLLSRCVMVTSRKYDTVRRRSTYNGREASKDRSKISNRDASTTQSMNGNVITADWVVDSNDRVKRKSDCHSSLLRPSATFRRRKRSNSEPFNIFNGPHMKQGTILDALTVRIALSSVTSLNNIDSETPLHEINHSTMSTKSVTYEQRSPSPSRHIRYSVPSNHMIKEESIESVQPVLPLVNGAVVRKHATSNIHSSKSLQVRWKRNMITSTKSEHESLRTSQRGIPASRSLDSRSPKAEFDDRIITEMIPREQLHRPRASSEEVAELYRLLRSETAGGDVFL